ncbi:bacterial Ig-like domain-containing protein [Listeria valentina]|uniref:bacterial Ig-like domain-containing protein n=1 Tax=Listeria valentina TaxID=2705293 RepID=UPI0014300C63|nr:bacterial Ig-like domain-containing protein [Listeria valentina]
MNFRKWLILCMGLVGIGFLFTIPTLFADDNTVKDLTLTSNKVDYSTNETINLQIKDSNNQDTKVIVPLPKTVTFEGTENGEATVTNDKANQQIVLDFKKGAIHDNTIRLHVESAGTYAFKAYTIRGDQTVNSKPFIIHVTKPNSNASDQPSEDNQADLRKETPDSLMPRSVNGSNQEEANKIKQALANPETSFSFKITKSPANNAIFKLSNVSLSQNYKGYKSINITLPAGLMLLKNSAKLPSGSVYTQAGNSVSITNTTGMQANVVTTFLAGLEFQYKANAVTGGNLKIAVEQESISNWIDDKGIPHYYVFVPNAIPWQDAYNEAKKLNYRGLTGYLATINSLSEHNFIFNSIAKEPGLLGGTRLVHMNNRKILDDASVPSTHFSKDVTMLNPDQKDWKDINQWYWADGPEAGTVFYNTKTSDSVKGPVKGVYSNFNTGEPNNGHGVENILQFAQNGTKFWNDLPDSLGYWASNHGYYVEFSQYGNQKEIDNSKSDHVEPLPAKVKVQYVDSKGSLLSFSNGGANPKLITGDMNAAYNATTPAFKLMNIQAKTGPYYLDETNLPKNGTGKITNKEQTVTYRYTTDLSSIAAKNSTIYVGESWNPKDNFVSAKDRTGKTIGFNNSMAKGTVNTSKAGKYTITYQNGPASKTITITVLTGTLKFVKVPEIMSFDNQKISNKMTESKRTDGNWKMEVEDTRPNKVKWRVTAQLLSPFTSSSGDKLSNSLVFRKPGQPDQLISTTGQVDVYDGTSKQNQRNYDVGWSNQAGPLLKITPGEAKADSYTGQIRWTLVNAPI